MTIILIGLFVLGVLTRRFMQAFEVETWHLSIGFLVLAGILYALNVVRRSVVRPKTSLGLLSISSLIAAVFPWWFAFSNDTFHLFVAFMPLLFLLVMFVKISHSIRKGGGSSTMMMLGGTDIFYDREKEEAVAVILEQQMGDKLEEQTSGDPEDDRGLKARS